MSSGELLPVRWAWRNRVRTLARAAGVTALAFLTLELVLRLFGYGSYIIYTADQDLLWRPLPNQRGRTVAGHQPITINGAGFRYGTDLPAVDPGEFRIFTFGDSVTQGWGVDDDSHFSAVLERLLEEDPPGPYRYRVVSAGVNAYPIALCVRRFQKVLETGYQVDLALLAYSFNTGFEKLSRIRGAEREAFLRKVRIKGLVRRSALYNFAIEDLLRQAVYYRIRTRLLEGSWSYTKPAREELAEELAAYRGDLEAMKVAGDRHGVALVFLLLGTQGQRSGLSEYQTAFLEFARQRGIPVVNMVDRLRTEDHAPLFMDHNHPSATGHARIAAALIDLLETQHLVTARAAEKRGGEDAVPAEEHR